jgi:hypothetical protein
VKTSAIRIIHTGGKHSNRNPFVLRERKREREKGKMFSPHKVLKSIGAP